MPFPRTPRPNIFAAGIALALIFILILPLTVAVTILGARQVQ
jgi:hypothetical protein